MFGERLLDGQALGKARIAGAGIQPPTQVGGASLDISVQLAAIDIEGFPCAPDLCGGPPAQGRSPPEGIQGGDRHGSSRRER